MRELELGENELGMKVFINGVPDLASVPQEMLESILPALEREIAGVENGGRRAAAMPKRAVAKNRGTWE